MFQRTLFPLLLLPLLAASPAAQTDAVPYDSRNPVHAEHFYVLHENADGLLAFSAFAQTFIQVADPHSPVLIRGKYGAILEEDGNVVVYNARRHVVSILPLLDGEIVGDFGLESDVVYVQTELRSEPRVHAYSMQTGEWGVVSFETGSDLRVVLSEFAVGVHAQPPGPGDPSTIACFGARKGLWVQIEELTNVTSPIQADGNVVAAEVLDGSTLRAYAFSAVHNVGALSEELSGPDVLRIDHNVGYVQALDAASWSGSVFSAYDATWVTSTRQHDLSSTTQMILGDNYVALHDGPSDTPTLWEAIGSRPHDTWTHLPLPATLLSAFDDSIMLLDESSIARAFSGLGPSGHWIGRPVLEPVLPFQADSPRYHGAIDRNDYLLLFSPALGWIVGINGEREVGKAVISFRNNSGGQVRFTGYSPRWGTLQTTPLLPQGTQTHVGTSVVAWESTASDELWVFDSRRNEIVGPTPLDGGQVQVQGHQVLVVKDASVCLYSVQRGIWQTLAKPGGPIVFPLLQRPVLFENGGWLVDAVGDLVAFGTTNDVHFWHSYPEESEYYALPAVGSALNAKVAFSLRGEGGDIVSTYYSDERRFTPIGLPISFTGFAWIRRPLRISNHGIPMGSTTRHVELGLPEGAPMPVQVWAQTLNRKASLLPTLFVTSTAPEPLWVF